MLTLDLPDVRLLALTWGPPEGPLALLLHGFPDTAHTWRHLGPELAEDGWRVVAPFARGYAPSGPARSYALSRLVDDALAVRDRLGDHRSVLVGHDWGALTAYGVGVRHRTAFARTVTLAVPPVPALLRTKAPSLLLRQLFRSRYIGLNLLPGLAERQHAERLWARWSPGYDAHEDLDHLAASLPNRERLQAALATYRETARRPGLALTPGPSPDLFLHGDRDGCMAPALLARAAAGLRDTRCVPGTGHFLHLERPEVVNPLVRAALGQAPRP